MTAPDFDEPRMIYTGPLPPHLLRARDAAEEPSFDPAAETRRNSPLLSISAAAAVALVTGVGIGAFLPSLLRPPQAQAHRAAPAATPPTLRAAVEPVAPPAEELTNPAVAQSSAAAEAPPTTAPRAAVAIVASPHTFVAVTRERPEHAAAAAPCAKGASVADRVVCADPVVATADRDLQRAYQHAQAAGAPAASLRADEIDWLLFRNEAARRSPADLALAYRQRIDQLNNLADDPPH